MTQTADGVICDSCGYNCGAGTLQDCAALSRLNPMTGQADTFHLCENKPGHYGCANAIMVPALRHLNDNPSRRAIEIPRDAHADRQPPERPDPGGIVPHGR